MRQETVLRGSTIIAEACDNVAIKHLWKYPVPTAYEVSRIFDLFQDYTTAKVTLGLVACQGVRGSELCDIRWPDFTFDDEGERVVEHKHRVYKPMNHKLHSQTEGAGRNLWFKETKKPMWSKWLSDQIIGYARSCPRFSGNRIVPWSDGEPLRCIFKRLRENVRLGKLPGYEFLLDKTGEPVAGNPVIQFRCNPYSLRRFAMTFHYWVTFKKDRILTAKVFGHQKPTTTEQHYIMPHQAIGLDEKMIDDGINIDEFILVRGKKQMRLVEFLPDWQKRFLPAGQATLADFQ